jgi:hypothetical protein
LTRKVPENKKRGDLYKLLKEELGTKVENPFGA